jgi:hydrogenase assembly chaperone HypC/HupF
MFLMNRLWTRSAKDQGLNEAGYVEGQNITIEYHWAEDRFDRLPALAADLVGRKIDVIVTSGGPAPARAAKDATALLCLGIPGQIVVLDDAEAMLATVDVCGVRRQINLACIMDDDHPFEACLGDWVLVHVGYG